VESMRSQSECLWTEVVSVHWRPTLDFFDRKVEFLRAMEKLNALDSFGVHEDIVTAGLTVGSRAHLTPGFMQLYCYDGQQYQLLLAALEAAVQIINPHISHIAVSQQYLFPLEDDYDIARIKTAGSFFGNATDAHSIIDFALLFDGRVPGLDAKYQAEVGVIESGDAGDRLRRDIGRMGDGENQHVAEEIDSLLERKMAPPVSFFVDIRYGIPLDESDSKKITGSVAATVSAARAESERLADSLINRIKSE
jgi:hypothetical protein